MFVPESSAIAVFVDDKTFASDACNKRRQNLIATLKSENKCIMGCKKFSSLRYVPKNEDSRELWRRKLGIHILKRSDTVCDKHFENGELMWRNREPKITKALLKHNWLSQNRSARMLEKLETLTSTAFEEPKNRQKCVLGCTEEATLHRVPDDDELRELWRKKLQLSRLKISHRVCARHFSIGNKKRIPSQAIPNSPDKLVDMDQLFELEEKKKNKCVLGCPDGPTLHKVPTDPKLRNLWRDKLKLRYLKVSHKVCDNHFKQSYTRRIPSQGVPDSPIRIEDSSCDYSDERSSVTDFVSKNKQEYESFLLSNSIGPDIYQQWSSNSSLNTLPPRRKETIIAPPGNLSLTTKRRERFAREKAKLHKCIFGCPTYTILHKVPKNDSTRELWRQKLDLKELKVNHKVCNNHFVTSSPVLFPFCRSLNEGGKKGTAEKNSDHVIVVNTQNNSESKRACKTSKDFQNLVAEALEGFESEELKNETEVSNSYDSFVMEILEELESEINEYDPKSNNKDTYNNNNNHDDYDDENLIVERLDDTIELETKHSYADDSFNVETLEDLDTEVSELDIKNSYADNSLIVEALEDSNSETEMEEKFVVERLEEDPETEMTIQYETIKNNNCDDNSFVIETLDDADLEMEEIETKNINGNVTNGPCLIIEPLNDVETEVLSDFDTKNFNGDDSYIVEALEDFDAENGTYDNEDEFIGEEYDNYVNPCTRRTKHKIFADETQRTTSRSNALKSWLRTNDFFITKRRRES